MQFKIDRRTIVVPLVPSIFGMGRCKARKQMNGNKTIKCFGERYHTIGTLGVHAGFHKDSFGRTEILRWKDEWVD